MLLNILVPCFQVTNQIKYEHKNNQRLGQELLYRIHQEITHQKQQIRKIVEAYLEEKSSQ